MDFYSAGVDAALDKFAGFSPEHERQMIVRGLQSKMERLGPVGAANAVSKIQNRAIARGRNITSGEGLLSGLFRGVLNLGLAPLTVPAAMLSGGAVKPFISAIDRNSARREPHQRLARSMESTLSGAQPFDDPAARLSLGQRGKFFLGGLRDNPGKALFRPIGTKSNLVIDPKY